MNGNLRVGILGGTFDPIHLGHLEAASAARRALSLDRVLLLPSRTPPHRSTEPRASAFHRFAMAALAAADYDMAVSDLELRREGPSYTALTLEALHREGYSPTKLYFVTGSDAFAEVATWYDYPRILSLANFVVVSRPGAPRASNLLPSPQSPIPGAPTVISVEAHTPDVSSTEVRRRVGAGESIDGLVPSSVAGHIRRHRLYVPAPVAAVL
ncbi:MAG: nicotinate (nicotinamide) nucleotide adenylyltransferase [Acidobacteria bacterium]|nr:MAG: nicotinate (nicotinamide) nucleotide adenylyltransferase [Acidobacteriota bacterium]